MKSFSFKLVMAAFAVMAMAILAPPAAVQAETVSPPTDTSAAGELAFWNSIKSLGDVADFEVYLKAFPDGMFLDVATARYKELGGQGDFAATPETDVVVEQPLVKIVVAPHKPAKKVVRATSTKPASNSIFVKTKKPKQILAYRKSHGTVKIAKKTPIIGYKKKSKPVVYVKVNTRKPKPVRQAKRRYTPSPETLAERSGGGGGGSSGGGNGGSSGSGSGGGGGGGGSTGGGGDGGDSTSW